MTAAESYPVSYSNGASSQAHTHSKSTTAYPPLHELRARADLELNLSKNSSADGLLTAARNATYQVKTALEFGRPDLGYVEWQKCEQYIRMLQQHPDTLVLREPFKSKFEMMIREHEEQRRGVMKFEATLTAGQGWTSGNYDAYASARPGSRQAIYGAPVAEQNVPPPRVNRYTIVDSAHSARAGVGDVAQRHSRHVSEDQPSHALRSNFQQHDDPILARFSQLRTTTYPEDQTHDRTSSEIPESLKPERLSILNSTNGTTKPVGPRAIPVDKDLPTLPPRLSTKALLDSLPRAPEAVYSPVKGTQSLNSGPQQNTVISYVDTYGRPMKERPMFKELPNPAYIEPKDLLDRLKDFKLLLIDVRPRENFDEGHIHAKHVICIEPLVLRPGMPLEDLEDSLIYAPDDEITLFKRLSEYDLVVYYDQNTSHDRFLRGSPRRDVSPEMRYLRDALTDFNYYQRLQRPPAFLLGGLDAWVDLVSVNSLQTSKTSSASVPSNFAPKPPRRRPHRISLIGANSSREIRAQRLRAYDPLNADEERQWREKAKNEELAPTDLRQFQRDNDSDSISSQTAEEMFLPIQSYDDFFRKFPEPSQIGRQSMTSPPPPTTSNTIVYGPPSRPLPMPPQPPSIPSIPSRPAPIAARPSYSGVSDHRSVSQSLSQPHSTKTQLPIYTSRSLALTLKLPRTGLKNFGVTCYMNGTIQCLNATLQLSRFFLDESWKNMAQKNWKGSNGIMPEIFSTLIRALWQGQSQAVRPSSFRNFCARLNPEWGIDRQQDAKEFLDFLIDCLHEDFNENWNRTPLRNLTEDEEFARERMAVNRVSRKEWERYSHRERSFVSNLFAGQHASRLRCTTCNNTSTTYEAFYSISVEIPRTGSSDVRQCLKSYCQEERLSGEEEWRCPHCKVTREATKQIIITRLPQILVLHFKRFSASKTESARKVHTQIDFPLYGLDMQPYMGLTQMPVADGEWPDPAITPPFMYDCYAVMRHIGQTGNGGHYIALCRDTARGCWRKYDDDHVNDFDPAKLKTSERLQNQQAYIVFYERATPR